MIIMSEITETAVTISIDKKSVSAKPGQLLIDVCSEAGVYIPHFCYHPRMKSVGMCRMCLVEVDTGRGPALMTSCTVPVAENMEVTTTSETVKKVQDGMLEFLLINHPLDCPVCDKGGECPLQDQTVAFGPGESRFVEDKRHFVKPIPINSQIFLDRERCVLCDRCTRFADEVAGEALISFQDRGQYTQVNTFPEAEFDSYFSGNTVEICPVGALTAEPYRFKARPWDLIQAESTYPNPMGDRIIIQASNNELVRILGLDSDAVNWGWLTDKDRFGFQAVSSPQRITTPLIRKSEVVGLTEVSWHEAISSTASILNSTLNETANNSIAVLGGANMANEDQFVWTRLAKGIICTDNVDASIGEGFPPEIITGINRSTLDEALSPGSVVLFLGSDVKEELGTLYLRLRHALINDGVELVELTPTKTSLTHLAKHSLRVFPGEINLEVNKILQTTKTKTSTDIKDINKVIKKAASEEKLTVMFSLPSLAESPNLIAGSVQSLKEAFGDQIRFLPVLRNGNIFGAMDMGLVPGVLPGGVSLDEGEKDCLKAWGKISIEKGSNATGILNQALLGNISTLILLGEDPLGSFNDSGLVDQVMQSPKKPKIIALDKFLTPQISKYADIVLPVAALGEREGSHTNLEGRISFQNKIISPVGTVRCEWEIAQELGQYLEGKNMEFEGLEDIWEEIQNLSKKHKNISYAQIRNSKDGVLSSSTSFNTETSPDSQADFSKVGIAKDTYSYRLIVRRRSYDGSVWQMQCSVGQKYVPDTTVIYLNSKELNRLGVETGSSVEVINMGEAREKKPLILISGTDDSLPDGVVAMNFVSHASMLVDSGITVNDVLVRKIDINKTDIFKSF